MKQVWLGLILLLGCGDPGGPGATLEVTADHLSGTWRTTTFTLTSIASPDKHKTIPSHLVDMTFSGEGREGSFVSTLTQPDTVLTGTWRSFGDTLITTIHGISGDASIVHLTRTVLVRESFPAYYTSESFDGGEPEPARYTIRAVRVGQ
jgi:hypothetical protein